MIYIKKYYRKAMVILVPLIILIVIIYLIGVRNKPSIDNTIDELLIDNNEDSKVSSHDIKVNIKGAVVNPGVYSFATGERVIDAIEKSGGLLENADTSVINLSKNLFDEMVIVIYTYDEVLEMKGQNVLIQYVEKECNCPKLENDACLVNNEKDNSDNNLNNINSNSSQKISINTASIEELQNLSGIGESKAKSIVDYRNTNGPFSKIEDIMNVSGIDEKVFEKIRDNITI